MENLGVIYQQDYEGYRIQIFRERVSFIRFLSESREVKDDIPDLKVEIVRSPEGIIATLDLAKRIIRECGWCYYLTQKGAKIFLRYTADDSNHGWCWKTEKDGAVSRKGLFKSPVAAINDAIESIK